MRRKNTLFLARFFLPAQKIRTFVSKKSVRHSMISSKNKNKVYIIQSKKKRYICKIVYKNAFFI